MDTCSSSRYIVAVDATTRHEFLDVKWVCSGNILLDVSKCDSFVVHVITRVIAQMCGDDVLFDDQLVVFTDRQHLGFFMEMISWSYEMASCDDSQCCILGGLL